MTANFKKMFAMLQPSQKKCRKESKITYILDTCLDIFFKKNTKPKQNKQKVG